MRQSIERRTSRRQRAAPSSEPTSDALAVLAARAVDVARAEPSLSRASQLAERLGVSRRTLERFFRRYVGVGPKWIVRRFRIHEACERIAAGAPACWSALAAELGYFDQAHFIRDFKSQVGRTPSEYAALTALEIAPSAPRGSPRRSPRNPRPSPATRRSAAGR